ncbi:FtsX-like permease family protein [Ectothiorhodospira shaposhnikovii]|uniref:FtsX-like permease family protein n=1 Tax=Ectothiorhodospira shaposhnikovii TaxID=1054 RepID=UPI0039A2BB21
MKRLTARALIRDHRRHPWNLIFAVLGVALGVAIVVAVDIANSSASRAFGLSMETVTGRTTHQLVGGPGGLEEGLYTQLRLQGFRDSAPVVEGHARIHGETFILLGLEPFAERPFRDHAAGGRDGRINRLITAAGEIHAQSMAIFDRTFAVTHVLRLLTVGVAFIGILSALMALQLERSREHAVLRATGMTPLQLAGMVTLQSLLLGLAAGLAAIPLGMLMSDVLIEVINQRSFGWSMTRTLPPAVLVEGLLLALTASLLAGAYPGYRMARVRPAEHLREA